MKAWLLVIIALFCTWLALIIVDERTKHHLARLDARVTRLEHLLHRGNTLLEDAPCQFGRDTIEICGNLFRDVTDVQLLGGEAQ